MSKMSELHIELSEQAYELGFKSIEDAEQHGWRVNYELAKLEPPVVQPELNELKELEKAHKAWLKERDGVLADLRLLLDEAIPLGDQDTISALERAIDFVEKGEC